MPTKFKLLDQVKVKSNIGYPETQFIIQAIRYNSHVKMFMYYGTDSISAYEDELELIITISGKTESLIEKDIVKPVEVKNDIKSIEDTCFRLPEEDKHLNSFQEFVDLLKKLKIGDDYTNNDYYILPFEFELIINTCTNEQGQAFGKFMKGQTMSTNLLGNTIIWNDDVQRFFDQKPVID